MINAMLNSKHKHIWINISFLILSIVSIYLMAITFKTTGMGDTPFHLQRILEVKYGIQHLTIPKIALSHFNYDGSAIMLMYPYITLIPFAISAILIKSIIGLFYFIFAFYIFVGMIIAFYSSRKVTQNDLTSYLFAVIYGMIGNFGLNNTDFGVNIVIVVLPLTIFGMILFIKYNRWLQLSIGMTLILFSNLLAFTITISIFSLFLIINYKRINKCKIKNLIKAILLSLLTTSIFLIPFLKISLLNNLQIPKIFWLPNMMDKIQHSLSINLYVSRNVGMNMNYIATLTIFGGLFFIKRLKGFTKQFYLIGSLLFIFYSSEFIWKFIANSPFKFLTGIQFPTRFYFISQIMLNFVFATLITKYINYSNKKQLFKTVTLILGFVVLSQMSMQWCFYNESIANTMDSVITKQNENQYSNMSYNGNTDYYPDNSINMINYLEKNKAIYNNNKTIKSIPNGKGNFSFNIPKKNIKELSLPFIYYNGIHYQVKLDNKIIQPNSDKHSLMNIQNINKGKHNVQISTKNSWDNIIAYIMFIISLIIYCYLFYKYIKSIKTIKNTNK